MKILLSAYACEPGKGSEQGVGWNFAQQLARTHEVWVITRANNQGVIEKAMEDSPNTNLHFSYLDLPPWLSFWKKGVRGLYLYYFLWQFAAYFRARRLHAVTGFHIVHHITFGAIWLPCLVSLLPVPFVWGPLGGFESIPRAFRKEYPLRARVSEALRDVMQWWILNCDPLVRFNCRKASVIIARAKVTAQKLTGRYHNKIFTMLETGIDNDGAILNEPSIQPYLEKIRIVMIGRLIPWKGFSLGIRAFACFSREVTDAHLYIIGTGPEEKSLKEMCSSMGIGNKVIFTGQIPHDEVLGHLKEADIFLLPSLKDAGTWVLFEAMEAGLPVVCFDHAGPGEIVNESCGIKIQATDPETAILDFAQALETLARDRSLRERFRAGARKRLHDYNWEDKGKAINEIFDEKLSRQVSIS